MSEFQRPFVEAEAQCACGGVTVTISGKVRSMFMCACEDCQKATGTGHSAFAVFDSSDVTVAGQTRDFATAAASGATLTRTFCPTCGNPIHGRSSRWETAIMLPVGLLGDATWFAPSQLIFARSHRDWDAIAGAIPQYDTYRPRRE